MADFGITVSSNNVDTTQATTSQQLLTSKYPLMKLDRTNKVSFQNLRIFFANEPPAPAVGTTTVTTTLITFFPHGYKYVPKIWSFCRAVGVTGQFQGSITYFLDRGLIGGNGTAANAPNSYAYVEVDATNVYVYVTKFTGTVGPPIFLAGATLNFRIYVQVDDVVSTT